MRNAPLSVRLLGELEIVRGGVRAKMPQSKKTRALLGYLVASSRSHRRERLCDLLWDVADDPRGALRWSLSKIRPLVDDPANQRIVADRESVRFDPLGASVDIHEVTEFLRGDPAELAFDVLAQHAAMFRGGFLEGLDLSEFDEFQAWCIAEREQYRRLHVRLLDALVAKAPDAEHAVAYARVRAQIDPLHEPARASLVELLGQTGRVEEAEQQFQSGQRLFKELGGQPTGALEAAWQGARRGRPAPRTAPVVPAQVQAPAVEAAPESRVPRSEVDRPFVGRSGEVARAKELVEQVVRQRRAFVLALKGEAGAGKSRLVREVVRHVRGLWGTVLDGAAFEAELGRPYGPWIDALRRLPPDALSEASELAPLLPDARNPDTGERSRERLYAAMVRLLESRASTAGPVLLVIDDFHWCDEASTALLHYVVRTCRGAPLLVLLAARTGELGDNAAAVRTVRAFRRDRVVEEMELGPLDREDIAALVRWVDPEVDAQKIYEESSGNALFALEMARSPQRGAAVPPTLGELVADRVDRLTPEAADVLRWAAVLGRAFGAGTLGRLVALDMDALVAALGTLERHALISAAERSLEPGGGYHFAHDLVRRVVYGELSEPRRRLMHHRVAQYLDEQARGTDEVAGDVARHAALAGQTEMAARACVRAGRRCVRLFANAEAETLARRGMRHARELSEPQQTELLLELLHVSVTARRPDDVAATAQRAMQLAETALDHGSIEQARLGFNMVGYLRWERGDWHDAEAAIRRAEFVSRAASEQERVVAMAEAARCLVLLERDLSQAEALAREAQALVGRLGWETSSVFDALGLLDAYHGELESAEPHFLRARDLARRDGERYAEFEALAHAVMGRIDRGELESARGLVGELAVLAQRFREGSEAPFATALGALCHLPSGEAARAELEAAQDELRRVDAKHRLAYTQNRAAKLHFEAGRAAAARVAAEEALSCATALALSSETARAQFVLAKLARDDGDAQGFAAHRAALLEQRVGNLGELLAAALDVSDDSD